MKTYRPILVAILVVTLALVGLHSAQHVKAAATEPSWELTAGPAGVCTGNNISMPGVFINAPSPASEQGTLTAPGFGQIGYTQDGTYTGVGPSSFTVFTDPYTVPANTHLTLSVTTYNGPNYTGGVSFISTLTWDCTTGATISLVSGPPTSETETAAPVPGCDVQMAISSTSTGGTFIADAPTSWTPGQLTDPLVTIPAGKSAWVLGLDSSGQYYKIVWSCSYLWVPANTLGPNFDAVWQGHPLPTGVVN